MNIGPTKEWYDWKIDICKQICKINETEAKIILCCLISHFAALLWPGRSIDYKRFVQTLIDFAPKEFKIDMISIPLLELNLEDDNEYTLAEKLISIFDDEGPYRTQVLTGSEIDKYENEILEKIHNIELKKVRQSSYACIIYRDLRCYLMHEYMISNKIDNRGMAKNENEPSYVNISMSIDRNCNELLKNKRIIYIPYEYFFKLVTSTADEIFKYWESVSKYEKIYPQKWWIEG